MSRSKSFCWIGKDANGDGVLIGVLKTGDDGGSGGFSYIGEGVTFFCGCFVNITPSGFLVPLVLSASLFW
jgi:hypothetical protein